MRRSPMQTYEHVYSRRLLEPSEISVYHFLADQVQVQVILLHPLIPGEWAMHKLTHLIISYAGVL